MGGNSTCQEAGVNFVEKIQQKLTYIILPTDIQVAQGMFVIMPCLIILKKGEGNAISCHVALGCSVGN